MMELVEIDDVWDSIEVSVGAVKAKVGASWTVEQFYSLCKSGEWMLFCFGTGWASCKVYLDQFTGEKVLEVTGCYNSGKSSLGEYYSFMEMLASSMGVNYIEVISPRKGWSRRGFTPTATVYRKEIHYGQ